MWRAARAIAVVAAQTALIWVALCALTGCASPITAVLSGSMRPGMDRGDLLLLTRPAGAYAPGDVVVYAAPGRPVPIVHRIIRTREAPDGTVNLLTKGDNNTVDDVGLYPPGRRWLGDEHVLGRVRGVAHHVGLLTVLLSEHPWLKVAFIAAIALYSAAGAPGSGSAASDASTARCTSRSTRRAGARGAAR